MPKKKAGHYRIADNYKSTLNKLQSFYPNYFCKIEFIEVDDKFINRFTQDLYSSENLKQQTVNFYIRNFRSIYNQIVSSNEDLFVNTQPFRKVKTTSYIPYKRAIPKDCLKKLFTAELRMKLNNNEKESLDVLIFLFFMRGMVFQDLFMLKESMIDDNGILNYRRSKTGTEISLSVPKEGLNLIKKYRCHNNLKNRLNNDSVFPFLHYNKRTGETIEAQSSLRRVNKHAAKIGKLICLNTPLSTYVLRHSWATLMLECGKSVEIISQCLGHTNIKTTQIYLSKISLSRTDSEVENVYNSLFRKM